MALVLAIAFPSGALAADKRTPIAVMELQGRGVDEASAGALTTEVSNTLAQLRVFRVITREDIKRMVQLQQTRQQCSGEVDAACMAEIGGALGVDYLVYGEVAKIADTYNLSMVLLDIAKAEAANRVSKKITDTRALLTDTESAAKLLVQPLLESRKGFLVLDVREKGAKVSVDGKTVGLSPLAGRLELPMGAHEVMIEKTGFMAWARTIDVPPSQALVEPVSMMPSQEFINEYESSATRTRVLAWATAGAAVVLVGAAGVIRLVDDAHFDDLKTKGYLDQRGICAQMNPNYNGSDYCPTALGYQNGVIDKVNKIERWDTVALGALITGVVSGVVSVYFFATGEPPGRYESYGAAPKTAAFVSPNGASFGGTF
jgi:TolB-like protein